MADGHQEVDRQMPDVAKAKLCLDLLVQDVNWRQRDAVDAVYQTLAELSDAIRDAQRQAEQVVSLLRTWDHAVSRLALEVRRALEVIDHAADVESALETQIRGEGGPRV